MKQKERSIEEIEYLFLLAIVVAGKQGRTQRAKLDQLLSPKAGQSPLAYVKALWEGGTLEDSLRSVGMGQYNRLMKCLGAYFERQIDLKTCSVDDLEAIPGIGPKTARFFLAYTRPGYRCAVLDVHILAFLREHGVDAPRHTPQNREKYKELEQKYLALADELDVDPTQLDDYVWQQRAWRPKEK